MGCAGREGFAERVFALLVPLQDFAGAFNFRGGQAGEAGHFDAVTLVGAAGFDAAEKNNLAGRLLNRDMNVFHRGQKLCKLGQLMVVGGEKRARADVLLKMLDNRPGDGEAVKRGGAAADFVEEDKTRGGGVGENDGDLAHVRAVMSKSCCRPGSKQRSLGTKRSPRWRRSSSMTGWRPATMRSSPEVLNCGRV